MAIAINNNAITINDMSKYEGGGTGRNFYESLPKDDEEEEEREEEFEKEDEERESNPHIGGNLNIVC